jgi:hypothetical protein
MTVAALITGGNTEQLSGHLTRAKENGLTETELKEVITYLADLSWLAKGHGCHCRGKTRLWSGMSGFWDMT